jgi:hypothetical protein
MSATIGDVYGNSLQMNNLGGQICEPNQGATVWGVAISAALTGTLTITGLTNSSGTPVAWTQTAGNVGWYGGPGGNKTSWGLSYTLSSASDKGLCTIMFVPKP